VSVGRRAVAKHGRLPQQTDWPGAMGVYAQTIRSRRSMDRRDAAARRRVASIPILLVDRRFQAIPIQPWRSTRMQNLVVAEPVDFFTLDYGPGFTIRPTKDSEAVWI